MASDPQTNDQDLFQFLTKQFADLRADMKTGFEDAKHHRDMISNEVQGLRGDVDTLRDEVSTVREDLHQVDRKADQILDAGAEQQLKQTQLEHRVEQLESNAA